VRANHTSERLAAGRTVICGWLSMDSRYLAEQLSYAGFDAVTVDLQHGMFGLDAAIDLLQAVAAGPATPLARCPSHDPAVIGKLLDAGAYGIICPAVDSPAQAEAFVAACRYPPAGRRSYGPARGLLYGGSDYFAEADGTISTWAMIESRPALDNVEEILATPGLDGVYLGPNDLALAVGEQPGRRQPPPATRAALERVLAAAQSAGKHAGIYCADGVIAREMAELGFGLVTPGNDVTMLKQVAAARIAEVRGDRESLIEGGGY